MKWKSILFFLSKPWSAIFFESVSINVLRKSTFLRFEFCMNNFFLKIWILFLCFDIQIENNINIPSKIAFLILTSCPISKFRLDPISFQLHQCKQCKSWQNVLLIKIVHLNYLYFYQSFFCYITAKSKSTKVWEKNIMWE